MAISIVTLSKYQYIKKGGGVGWIAHEILETAQSPNSYPPFLFDFGLGLGLVNQERDKEKDKEKDKERA